MENSEKIYVLKLMNIQNIVTDVWVRCSPLEIDKLAKELFPNVKERSERLFVTIIDEGTQMDTKLEKLWEENG